LGISENMQEKVFEPYFQVNRKNLSSQGIGMGLSIVNNIVKSLDGKILLNSKENEGSEFSIILKRHFIVNNEVVAKYEPKTSLKIIITADNVEDAISENNKSYVFIIEDNNDMLLYLRNKLKDRYNIYVAENGSRALEKLKNIHIPDLIISDVMMDEMDGFSFFKEIANNPNYNYIPFIFLTAKATSDDKLRGLNLGAIDYINKPFSIYELSSKVDAIINTSQKQKKTILNAAAEMIINNLDSPRQKSVSKKDNFEDKCQSCNITDREKEIIQLISEGLTYKEISQKLNLSENTLVKHRTNIFKKLHVNNKVDLLNKLFV
jgi:DNA-binding NarL/FixJ family response regulator